MKSRSQLIKLATARAEELFDKQMLDHLETIKKLKGLHAQHRFMLVEYVEVVHDEER